MMIEFMHREKKEQECFEAGVGVVFVCVHGAATYQVTNNVIAALQNEAEKKEMSVTYAVSFDHDASGFMNALAVEDVLGYIVYIVRLDIATAKFMAEGEMEVMLDRVGSYWEQFVRNTEAHEDFLSDRKSAFEELDSNGRRVFYTNNYYTLKELANFTEILPKFKDSYRFLVTIHPEDDDHSLQSDLQSDADVPYDNDNDNSEAATDTSVDFHAPKASEWPDELVIYS